MTDLSERRTELRAKEEALHNAYMASEPGSQEERTLELALEEVMDELDALFREEQAEWETESARSRRVFLLDAAYGRML
jgi:hypothetical protein